jgi:hypothetical protein
MLSLIGAEQFCTAAHTRPLYSLTAWGEKKLRREPIDFKIRSQPFAKL